jgi:hypothetical protein
MLHDAAKPANTSDPTSIKSSDQISARMSDHFVMKRKRLHSEQVGKITKMSFKTWEVNLRKQSITTDRKTVDSS